MKKIIALFFIIGFLVYFQSLFNGFVWDDVGQIVGNYNLYGFDKFFSIFFYNWSLYYKPLFYLVLSFLLSVFGDNPFPFHLLQLLIHITNSILIFALFSKFFKKNISFLLSLVFLIHPAISEAVLYISAIQDVLYPFFGLLALNVLMLGKKFRYKDLFVFLLLMLSILSKETGIAFLAIVIIYKFLFDRVSFKKYLIFTGIFITFYIFLRIGIADINPLDKLDSQSQWTYDADLHTRLLTAPKIIFKYLSLSVWPDKLQIFQLWWVRQINFANFYLPLISVIIFFSAVFAYAIRKYNAIKNNIFPFFFFVSFLVIGILLHAQIIPLDMTFAERWFYVPLIGLLGMAGFILNELKLSRNKLRVLYLIFTIIIIIFSTRTFLRSFDWHDLGILTIHDSNVDRQNIGTYFVLGDYYVSIRNYPKALEAYSGARKISPQNENVQISFWVLAINEKDYKKAEEILRNSPKVLLKTKINYTYTLMRINLSKAEQYAQKNLNDYPQSSEFNYLVALTKYAQGDRDGALRYMSIAVKLGWRHSELKRIQSVMENGGKLNLDYSKFN